MTLTEALGRPVPAWLVAVTVKVYCLPVERPFTVIGLMVPLAFCPEFEVTV